MAKSPHRLELRVGMLIVAGMAATVIIILLSDRFSFERDYTVTAFLQNSGGLHQGSPVTLSGIEIGKVETISSVQDARGAIKVVMSINENYRLPGDVTLQLSTNGFFGDSFLAFSGSGKPTSDFLRMDGTAVVEASRGFFDEVSTHALKIMGSVSDLLGPDTRNDMKKLVRGAADLAEHSAAIAKDLREETRRVDEFMVNLNELTVGLKESTAKLADKAEQTMRTVDQTLANLDKHAGDIAQNTSGIADSAKTTMAKVDTVLDHGDKVLTRNEQDLQALITAMREMGERSARLLADAQRGKGVLGQLLQNEDLAKDLNEISINMTLASELISEHPEALVFGTSNEQFRAQRAKKDRMRMRRAFQEGFFNAEEAADSQAAANTNVEVKQKR
jgi:phospholipid/cholesterol/gamma-HCH transport system substrate-binding protein